MAESLAQWTQAKAYLTERGINDLDIQRFGIKLISRDELGPLLGFKVGGSGPLCIWYSHPSGWGQCVVFNNASGHKKWAPKGKSPRAWIMPGCDWNNIPMNTTVEIHESFLKAAWAVKDGRYAIGLNGVNCWSGGSEHGLVEDLQHLPVLARNLSFKIVFDSNAVVGRPEYNIKVSYAINGLAYALKHHYQRAGTTVNVYEHHCPAFPAADGENWGYDDIRVAGLTLDGEPTVADSEGSRAAITALNREVAYIVDLNRIVRLDDPDISYTKSGFVDLAYADRMYDGADGERHSAARAWVVNDRRSTYRAIVYAPGKGPEHDGNLNIWKGMGLEPERGDLTPIMKHLTLFFRENSEREWVLNWLAYPLQNLGAKLPTAVYLNGVRGAGKSYLSGLMLKIYGSNGVMITTEQLMSQFTSVYANRQYWGFEEAVRAQGSRIDLVSAKIRNLITAPSLIVNKKNSPEYSAANLGNLVITSQDEGSIRVEEEDRRLFAPTLNNTKNAPYWDELWDEKVNWAARFYGFLLDRDLSGWNPQQKAPTSELKRELEESSVGTIEGFCRSVFHNPNEFFDVDIHLVNPTQVVTAYADGEQLPVSVRKNLEAQVGKIFKDLGMGRASGGNRVRTSSGQHRWYVLRAEHKGLYDTNESVVRAVKGKF